MNSLFSTALVLVLWCLPGLALARHLGLASRRNPVSSAAVTLALSAAISTAAAFVSLSVGLPSTQFSWVLLALSALGFVACWIPPRFLENPAGQSPRLELLGWLSLFVLVILGGVQGGAVSYTTDAPDHLGTLREILASGQYFPTEAFHLDAGSLGFDPRKGLLHPVFAALASLARCDVVDFWLALPLLTALFPFTGFYALLRAAGARPGWALGGAWVGVFTWSGGLADGYVPYSAYPNQIGASIFWLAAASGIQLLERPDRLRALTFAIIAFAAIAVHPMYLVFVALLGGLLALYTLLFARTRPHLLSVTLGGAGLLALCAPYLMLRFAQYAPANSIHTELQGMLFLTDRWYLANPAQLWPYVGVAGLFGYLGLLIACAPRARRHPASFVLFCGALALPLLTLNPLLVPPLQAKLTYLIFRTPWFLPPAVAAGVVWSLCFASPRRAPRLLATVVLAAVVIPAVLQSPTWVTRSHLRDGPLDALRQRAALHTLDAALPARSVIATDPVTGYVIPAFTSNRVVATLDQHTSPNDALAEARAIRVRDILSPATPVAEAWRLSRGADVVLINADLPDGIATRYWTSNRFEALFRVQDFLTGDCFEADATVDGISTWIAAPACDESGDATEIPGEPAHTAPATAFHDGLALRTAQAVETTVERGAPLTLQVTWMGDGSKNPAQVTASVRLDAMTLPGGTSWGGKLQRKFQERVQSQAFRTRADWSPGQGRIAPDHWPAGWVLTDELEVGVPAYLAPGRYVVRISWNRFPYMPNRTLADLLRNDDVYWGTAVDTVEVRASTGSS